jgi:hypothetical protein
MNRPYSLFAFRKAFFEGHWHIRCINCSDTAASQWDGSESWNLFSTTDQPITVSLPAEECETSGIPLGPAVVYGRDAAIESLSSPERTRAIVAQNHVVVVTDCDLSEMKMPTFLMDRPSQTIQSEITIRFTSPFLDELPDVQVYEIKNSSITTGAWGLDLFSSVTSTPTRLPTGFHLPATIQTNLRTQSVVYAIKEWRSDYTATVYLFTSKEMVLDKTSCLIRELQGAPVVLLGTCAVC